MAKNPFILNDPPYGSERSYNALRLAAALSKREGEKVNGTEVGVCGSCMDAPGITEADRSLPRGGNR